MVKIDSRDLTGTAVFAALYVVINILQAITVGNPTIYGPIQLRLADFMIALAILFGWPIISGVTLGCFLTNAYYFLGVPDVILGPIANFVAAWLVFLLRKRRLLACVAGSLPIGLIVGSYLWLFFPPPDVLSGLPAWSGMIISVTVSSLIAVAVIGYLVVSMLGRPNIIKPLKSRGLKVIFEK
ncbi:MAG: QueT transporter family protein [Candidatus Bathyarchaeota archaeon]|nr:QueT transporter family protein [Candidatus Bathyarchaeota archaeon]